MTVGSIPSSSRVNVLKNLVIAESHFIFNQSADATMLLTATGKRRNVTEFTNIVRELVMNKKVVCNID
jgi:hypothetical protein